MSREWTYKAWAMYLCVCVCVCVCVCLTDAGSVSTSSNPIYQEGHSGGGGGGWRRGAGGRWWRTGYHGPTAQNRDQVTRQWLCDTAFHSTCTNKSKWNVIQCFLWLSSCLLLLALKYCLLCNYNGSTSHVSSSYVLYCQISIFYSVPFYLGLFNQFLRSYHIHLGIGRIKRVCSVWTSIVSDKSKSKRVLFQDWGGSDNTVYIYVLNFVPDLSPSSSHVFLPFSLFKWQDHIQSGV